MYCMPGLATIIPGPAALGIMPGCRPPGPVGTICPLWFIMAI